MIFYLERVFNFGHNCIRILKTMNNLYAFSDDLLVTNPTRVQKGIDLKACNSLLLKVNQIGTVTEAIKA